MFGISSGNFVSASSVLSQIGVGNNSSASFHLRKGNSLQYETPTFAGVTFGYQYSPDESRDTTNAAGACATGPGGGNCGRDASLHSYGVKWDSEKFYLSLHQEVHNDFFGGSNNVTSTLSNAGTQGAHSQDLGTRFSAQWHYLADQRVTLDIARLKYREFGQAAGTHFESYAHNTWAIGWDAAFGGPWRFAAQYVRGNQGACTLTGGAACSTDGLTGYMMNVGVRYRFDSQTFVYLIGSKLNNGPSARYDNWAASSPARGADILQTALGLSYTF
jgi:predicted porin